MDEIVDCDNWYYDETGYHIHKETNELTNELTGIENWFKERNLDKADPSHQMIKATEELGELAEAHNKGWDDKAKDSLGDLVVALDGYALQRGWHLADCIKDAHNEIRNRKGKVINGVFVKQSDLDKE